MDQDTIPFAFCSKCAGLWFKREVIEHTDPTPASIPDASRRTRRIHRISRQPRPCPACAIAMTKENIDGIDIDRCAQCRGVWLDPGEYEAARQRLRAPSNAPRLPPSSKAGDAAAGVAFDGLAEVLLWLSRA